MSLLQYLYVHYLNLKYVLIFHCRTENDLNSNLYLFRINAIVFLTNKIYILLRIYAG